MSEIPVRIYFRANNEANSYSLINQSDNNWLLALLVNGEHTTAMQAQIMEAMQARWNLHDDLVTSLALAWQALKAADQIVFRAGGEGAVSVQLAQARDNTLAAIAKAKGGA